ncbi:MAG: hypothetical protein L0211_23250 [Planctomycetaceae bacterium]|nr:hypothetical protein [Planctomycetaceae bacterium]
MTTRHFALAFVLAVPVLAGCNPAAKVIGTWDMQLDAPDSSASGFGTYVPPAIQQAIKPKMNIEFKENGTCVVEAYVGGQKAEARGKWKYVESEKDVTTLKVTMPGAKEKEDQAEKEIKLRFIDHNNVEMVLFPIGDDGWEDLTMKFKRRDF